MTQTSPGAWRQLLDPEIRDFIHARQDDDVREIALKKPPAKTWPFALVVDQIKARQKAALKMPGWLKEPNIVFPASDIVEQASSSATAHYKAGLVNGKTFVDLTGGCGMDAAEMAKKFESGFCVERDEIAAQILAHNLSILCDGRIKIHAENAEDFVASMKPVDVICIDPQRRNENRKGLYKLSDSSPDIESLLPQLKNLCGTLMLKTSPLLDITHTINALQHVSAVHVIEWKSTCREVVYILDFKTRQEPVITAASIDSEGRALKKFSFTLEEEAETQADISMPLDYIFEPGAAFQKAGGFNSMAKKFRLKKLHRNTHLYTAAHPCAEFPGRSFSVKAVLPVDRKALPFSQANLTLRNFPGDTAALRKKLGLKDGSEDYIFACTLADESRALIHGRKPG